jgi:hypothetical protein
VGSAFPQVFRNQRVIVEGGLEAVGGWFGGVGCSGFFFGVGPYWAIFAKFS